MLASLITLPYLTRILGPEQWGVLIASLVFNALLLAVLDYGFTYSATRSVAQCKQDPQRLAKVVATVNGTKLVLIGVCALLTVASAYLVPIFKDNPAYLMAAFFSAAVSTLCPWWYFQGIERLRLPAVIGIVSQIAATVSIFILIDGPEHGWMVLGLSGLFGLFFTVPTLFILYRRVQFQLTTWALLIRGLKDGQSLFIERLFRTLYSSSNALILALFTGPVQVGYYGSAEKLVKAVKQLATIVSRAVYPRMCALVASDLAKALRVRRLLQFAAVTGGAIIIVVGILGAEPAIRFIFGSGYEPAGTVLKILVLSVPLSALNIVLGTLWVLPHRKDKAFVRVTVSAGVFNLLLAGLLSAQYAHVGIAWAMVATELGVLLYLWRIVQRIDGQRSTHSKARLK